MSSLSLGIKPLEQPPSLNSFLAGVEQRAYRMAYAATRDRDDALDIVQDTMMRCADRYADRAADEWPPLFFRILQRRILDWHRRARVRRVVVRLFGGRDGAGADTEDPALAHAVSPERLVAGEQAMARLQDALAGLPLRQQQVFMLREMQGFDVRQTAEIMQCSDGTVKTHHARARATLRAELEDVIA